MSRKLLVREVPSKILAYFYSELHGVISQISKKCPLYEEMIQSGKHYPVLPPEIQKEIDVQRERFANYMQHEVFQVLLRAYEKFGKENLYGLMEHIDYETGFMRQPERYERAKDQALSLLGKERVMFNGMHDGDVRNYSFWKNTHQEYIPEWASEEGTSNEYVLRGGAKKKDTFLRFERHKLQFQSEISRVL